MPATPPLPSHCVIPKTSEGPQIPSVFFLRLLHHPWQTPLPLTFLNQQHACVFIFWDFFQAGKCFSGHSLNQPALELAPAPKQSLFWIHSGWKPWAMCCWYSDLLRTLYWSIFFLTHGCRNPTLIKPCVQKNARPRAIITNWAWREYFCWSNIFFFFLVYIGLMVGVVSAWPGKRFSWLGWISCKGQRIGVTIQKSKMRGAWFLIPDLLPIFVWILFPRFSQILSFSLSKEPTVATFSHLSLKTLVRN